MSLLELQDIFGSFFDSRIASSPAEIEEVLRIRYKVYCREASYFDPKSYPDGLERDIYDDRALQLPRERQAVGRAEAERREHRRDQKRPCERPRQPERRHTATVGLGLHPRSSSTGANPTASQATK